MCGGHPRAPHRRRMDHTEKILSTCPQCNVAFTLRSILSGAWVINHGWVVFASMSSRFLHLILWVNSGWRASLVKFQWFKSRADLVDVWTFRKPSPCVARWLNTTLDQVPTEIPFDPPTSPVFTLNTHTPSSPTLARNQMRPLSHPVPYPKIDIFGPNAVLVFFSFLLCLFSGRRCGSPAVVFVCAITIRALGCMLHFYEP